MPEKDHEDQNVEDWRFIDVLHQLDYIKHTFLELQSLSGCRDGFSRWRSVERMVGHG